MLFAMNPHNGSSFVYSISLLHNFKMWVNVNSLGYLIIEDKEKIYNITMLNIYDTVK